jgi:hypothetical protein
MMTAAADRLDIDRVRCQPKRGSRSGTGENEEAKAGTQRVIVESQMLMAEADAIMAKRWR